MRITACEIPEVKQIDPRVFEDPRGYVTERFTPDAFQALGCDVTVRQIVQSRSVRGVLRGLHFQHPHDQGKLVWVPRGRVWDVAVDVRDGSPWFGRHVAAELSEDNLRMLWIPPGFAHGFVTLSDHADMMYAITGAGFAPDCARVIRHDDPDIGIPWPISEPLLSDKDARAPALREQAVLPPFIDPLVS